MASFSCDIPLFSLSSLSRNKNNLFLHKEYQNGIIKISQIGMLGFAVQKRGIKMNSIKYITSLFTFYMKGEISAEQNSIKIKDPNSILGLIPLGSKKESIAINQISSVQSNFKLKIGKLIIGIILVAASFSAMFQEGGFLGGLILLAISVNVVLNAFEIDLNIVMTSGKDHLIDFFIFEKNKATLAEQEINKLIENRLDDTNTRQQTDRLVEAINNK